MTKDDPVEPDAATTSDPAPEPNERARRVARARSVAGLVLSGAAVLGTTGAVVGAGWYEPPPSVVAVPASAVDVPAPVTGLVCAGPVRLPTEPEPGGDVVYDPQFDPSPGESVTRLAVVSVTPPAAEEQDAAEEAASGALHPLGAPQEVLAELTPVAGAAVAGLDGLDRSAVLRADPGGQAPAWVAGAVSVTTQDGDLRGLVAASCQQPSPDAWLVGGSTELGSSARLVLQNPGLTAATVQVQLWGPAGPVQVAGAPEYLVPGGAERVVLLEGVAAEQRRIVVRLVAAGGLVTAYLQDSQLRGLLPAGVDYVVAGQPPARQQVVPGLSVPATEVGGADTAALRLLAPGDAGGTVRVTFLGADGPAVLPGAEELALEAGAVLDLPLGGLAAGDYTAVVESDVPVVAGALVTRGAGVGGPDAGTLGASPLDRAWAPSVPLGASGPLGLPGQATGTLLVAVVPAGTGPAPAAVRLQVIGADGAVIGERDLLVPGGTTTRLPLADLLGEAPGSAHTAASDGAAADPGAVPTEGAPAIAAPVVAGVVLRTDDPRVAWAGVLLAPAADGSGELVAVLAPVAPSRAQAQVPVRVR